MRRIAAGLLASCAFGCGLAVNGLVAVDADAPDAGACCVDGAGGGDTSTIGVVDGGTSDGAPVDATSRDALPDVAVGPPVDAAHVPDAAPPPDAAHPTDAAHPLDAAPDVVTVAVNDALAFAGGAYVEVGALAIPADFTVEAWIDPAPAAMTLEESLVAEDRSGQAAGQLRLGLAGGRLFFMMSDATGATGGLFAGNAYALESAVALPAASWSHVAVTKSVATFTLFVGATQAASFTASAALTYGGPPVAFRIGARVGTDGASPDGAFTGTIDEVRVWNRALGGAEIAASMGGTVSPAASGLAAYWRFDEGTGTTTADEEGSHPGTLVGPTWVVSGAF